MNTRVFIICLTTLKSADSLVILPGRAEKLVKIGNTLRMLLKGLFVLSILYVVLDNFFKEAKWWGTCNEFLGNWIPWIKSHNATYPNSYLAKDFISLIFGKQVSGGFWNSRVFLKVL